MSVSVSIDAPVGSRPYACRSRVGPSSVHSLAMDWVYYLLTLAAMVVGLWINILTLPGLWVMVASVAIYAWVTGGQYVGWPGLISLVVLAGLAEVVEFVAGGAGAKKAGGSKRAFVGAIIGSILGAIFLSIPFPVVGTIFGICAGTFIGAMVVEFMVKRDHEQAFRVGWGATLGRLIGILTKLAFGVVIFVVATILAWPTGAAPASLPAPPGATTMPAPPTSAPATPTTTEDGLLNA